MKLTLYQTGRNWYFGMRPWGQDHEYTIGYRHINRLESTYPAMVQQYFIADITNKTHTRIGFEDWDDDYNFYIY